MSSYFVVEISDYGAICSDYLVESYCNMCNLSESNCKYSIALYT